MPLRIELKPFERLIINGAAIRNGDRRASFLVETQCKFLRESEIITESEADTPAKRIHLTLTVLYLADDPRPAEDLFFAQGAELLTAMPDAAPYLVAIKDAVEAGEYHRAIKRGKDLVTYEAARRQAADPAPARG
jgi:flagellar biosynthesis repressor protein FlbT